MIEALKKDIEERFSEMDRSRIRIGTAGAGLTAAEAEEWCSEVEKAFPWAEVYYNPLSELSRIRHKTDYAEEKTMPKFLIDAYKMPISSIFSA